MPRVPGLEVETAVGIVVLSAGNLGKGAVRIDLIEELGIILGVLTDRKEELAGYG